MALLPLALLVNGCASAPPAPPPPPPFNPAGVYDCMILGDGFEMAATMTVEKTADGYTGAIDSEMGSVPMTAVVLEGMEMAFSVDPGGMLVHFRITFEGPAFAGGFEADGMMGTISGKKR
jgi:hypothetical protein